MKSRSMQKFSNNFLIGLVAGVALSAVVFTAVVVPIINDTYDWADENLELYNIAKEDIEKLQNTCGLKCRDLKITHQDKFFVLYPESK